MAEKKKWVEPINPNRYRSASVDPKVELDLLGVMQANPTFAKGLRRGRAFSRLLSAVPPYLSEHISGFGQKSDYLELVFDNPVHRFEFEKKKPEILEAMRAAWVENGLEKEDLCFREIKTKCFVK